MYKIVSYVSKKKEITGEFLKKSLVARFIVKISPTPGTNVSRHFSCGRMKPNSRRDGIFNQFTSSSSWYVGYF